MYSKKELIEKTKKALSDSGNTFAALVYDEETGNEKIYTSAKKGIAPIMDMLEKNRSFFKNAIVADRVIGKAAAMLLLDSGADYIFGEMTSTHALNVLEAASEFNEAFSFETGRIVPYIINRKGDGMCPMEETVLDITDLRLAYDLLKAKLSSISES